MRWIYRSISVMGFFHRCVVFGTFFGTFFGAAAVAAITAAFAASVAFAC